MSVHEAPKLTQAPWPHLEMEGFLPSEMASEIAAHWPADGWEWLKHSDITRDDGTSLRRYQPVSAMFPHIAAWLMSRKLQRGLAWSLNALEPDALYAFAMLIDDAPGYRIRSHTDCAGKVISCQVYLAEDDKHPELGVTLHTRDRSVKRQIPYRFNYGYAFKVTKDSWHRVEKADAPRRSIQLIYYDTPTPHL